jgi:hypothetical protein
MRHWRVAALVGVAAACAAGFAQAAPGGVTSAVRHTYGGVLALSFPPGWHVVEQVEALSSMSMSNSVVSASDQVFHLNCITTTPRMGSTGGVCRATPLRLRPNGVLEQWDQDGFPGWSIDESGIRGRSTTIDGLPALVSVTPDGTCHAALEALGTIAFERNQEAVGGDETITAVVSAREPGNFFTFSACIRGPNVAGLTNVVMASLRSARVLQPPGASPMRGGGAASRPMGVQSIRSTAQA